MTEQTDIAENPENPAVIPQRPLRPSELVELKILARDTKSYLSGLFAGMESWNVTEHFEEAPIRLSDTASLCDEIMKYCSEELKKTDIKRSKR